MWDTPCMSKKSICNPIDQQYLHKFTIPTDRIAKKKKALPGNNENTLCRKQNSAEPTVHRRQYNYGRENCRAHTQHRFSVTTAGHTPQPSHLQLFNPPPYDTTTHATPPQKRKNTHTCWFKNNKVVQLHTCWVQLIICACSMVNVLQV